MGDMVSGAARRLVILDAIACPSTDPQSLIGVVLCSKISAHAHCPIPNTQLFGILTIAAWICWTNSLMMMLQKELSFFCNNNILYINKKKYNNLSVKLILTKEAEIIKTW